MIFPVFSSVIIYEVFKCITVSKQFPGFSFRPRRRQNKIDNFEQTTRGERSWHWQVRLLITYIPQLWIVENLNKNLFNESFNLWFALSGTLIKASLSLLQTSKFSRTSFYVTSFICSSVRATLTIFSMYKCTCSKLACKTCQSTNFARLYGSTKKTCQSNLSTWCDWLADCQSKLVDTFTPVK